jgi:CBS domain-containing protein
MRCKEIMKTKIECVGPTDPIHAAARKMRDANVGFLPVCDESGKVLGAITDRDLVIRLVADDRPASEPVESVMTREVVSCLPDDDIEGAERLMADRQKSRVLVIDDDQRLVGVISLSDVAQYDGSDAAQTMRQITNREAHVV